MPEEGDRDRRWLVEPVGPEEVRVHVDLGEGVEISEQARTALDTLLASLYESEVEGFASVSCPSLKSCGWYICSPLGKCQWLEGYPCFVQTTCRITKLG